jgi:hypothetical protein
MPNLDPSYLRSIRDGILSGNIEANNNEALPDGLVGLYDKELFPPTKKWKERKETLDFFLVFALAQKEISAYFAAEILGDAWYNHADEDSSKEENRVQRVNDLIQLHSKRFSSAGGGKYRLYHERFRVYVLQKVSEQDITQFNAKFIALCETALQTSSGKEIPEKESYALEFISSHFFISAMQGKTECLNKEYASALKKYAYDQQFWERQYKSSKGFEWSKRMLNQMMSWASKFNEDEEVIECALNKVDLYHQEQNDAPRIVQLVADGDIETALKQIEQFGDKDKEGLQRKFILYMLCLMELTDKAYATEKKIKQINQFILMYEELFEKSYDFSEAIPFQHLFRIALNLDAMDVDYLILFSNYKQYSAINKFCMYKIQFSMREIEVANKIIESIDDEGDINFEVLNMMDDTDSKLKEYLMTRKITEGIQKFQLSDILAHIYDFEHHELKSLALSRVATNLIIVGKKDEANKVIELIEQIPNQMKSSNPFSFDTNNELAVYSNLINELFAIDESQKAAYYLAKIAANIDNDGIIADREALLYLSAGYLLADDLAKSNFFKSRYRQQGINIFDFNVDTIFSLCRILCFREDKEKSQLIIRFILTLHSDFSIADGVLNDLRDFVSINEGVNILNTDNEFLESLNSKNSSAFLEHLIFEGRVINSVSNEKYLCQFLFELHKNRETESVNKLLQLTMDDGLLMSFHETLTKVGCDIGNSIVEFDNRSIRGIEIADNLLKCIEPVNDDNLKIFFKSIDDDKLYDDIDEYTSDLKTSPSTGLMYILLDKVEQLCTRKDFKTAYRLSQEINEDIASQTIGMTYREMCLHEIGRRFHLHYNLAESILKSREVVENRQDDFEFVIRGVIERATFVKFENQIVLKACKIQIKDISLYETVLYKSALRQLFFSDLPQKKLNRFNRTLNIQWAIDIKNQLPN